ncbi:MAG TPA: type II toxin-antitoxin system VapC family toxin [Chloroflexota bacterium]|nr:type II toxin-antitoxin system VapC family toxin [Chloroflexota bacterium]
MRYLLDTDWTISYLNGREAAVALVEGLADDGLAVSIITCGEVYEGLVGAMATSAAARIAEFEGFLTAVDVMPLDEATARRYGEVRAALRATGQLLSDNDLWIAASCLAKDLVLVTRDTHFDRIPGLKRHDRSAS